MPPLTAQGDTTDLAFSGKATQDTPRSPSSGSPRLPPPLSPPLAPNPAWAHAVPKTPVALTATGQPGRFSARRFADGRSSSAGVSERPGSCPTGTRPVRPRSPTYATPFVPTNFSGFTAPGHNNVFARHTYDANRRPLTAPSSTVVANALFLGMRPGLVARPGTPSARPGSPPTQHLTAWRPASPTTRPHTSSASGRCDEMLRSMAAPEHTVAELRGASALDAQQTREKARALHFWQLHMEERGLLVLQEQARPDDGGAVGVSLEFLAGLADSLEYHHALPDSTLGVVVDLISPTTRPQQCRLVDMVPARFLGRPQYYVSHAWTADFAELVSTIKADLTEPVVAVAEPPAAGSKPSSARPGSRDAHSSPLPAPSQAPGGRVVSPDFSRSVRISLQGNARDDNVAASHHHAADAAAGGRSRSSSQRYGAVHSHGPSDDGSGNSSGGDDPHRSTDTGGQGEAHPHQHDVNAPWTMPVANNAPKQHYRPASMRRSRSSRLSGVDAYESENSDDEARQYDGVKLPQRAKGEDVFVWIDVLCSPQHAGPLGARKDLAKLRHLITDCTCLLLVVDTAAVALSRSWCLYEVYLALHLRQLLKVLPVPSLLPEVMLRAVRGLDVSKASASRVKDRAALTTELINGGCGLPEVNRILKESMAHTNDEREYELALLHAKTLATLNGLRRLEEPIPPAVMARARVLLQELLEMGYPRELSRLLASMPPASAGDADFVTVQRMGLLVDMMERQYRLAEAKEVRRINTRLFKAYSHRFVAARYENEITQAVMTEITSRKGYRKLVARIGKNVSPDLYNGG